jgi:hypothetical protein
LRFDLAVGQFSEWLRYEYSGHPGFP